MDLRITIRSGCFWTGVGLALAKVIEVAKEIRPDDKKRVKTCVKTPIRRSGCVPGGSVVCWRMLAFLGAGDARREGRAAGVGGAVGGGQGGGVLVCLRIVWAAAICGGNSAVFNQPLTTFLVVAMVWRLAVFFLCSYWQSRRLWRLFRSPGAWAVLGGLRGGFGGWLLPDAAREGVAEKGPVLPRIGGRVFPHILCSPPWTVGGGGAENRPGSSLQPVAEIICGPCWAFKIQGFY